LSITNIQNSIVKILETQELINNEQEVDSITYTSRGTGFFINKLGYFITAKHVIYDSRDIESYKIQYNGKKYSISKVEGISYSDNQTDIVIFKVNIQDDFNYIKIQNIDEKKITGDITVSGYSNNSEEIRLEHFFIQSFTNGIFKIKNGEKLSIKKGCSGSPVFKEIDDFTTQLIGIVSSTHKEDEVINFISSINLVKKINHNINDNLKEKIGFGANCLKTSLITKSRLLLSCMKSGKPKLFYQLHRAVEHKLIKLEYDLEKNYQRYSKQEKRIRVQELLVNFKKVFDIVAGDVAIHIKQIEKVENNQAYCKAISRVPSIREKDFDVKRGSDIEEFVISKKFKNSDLKREQDYFDSKNNTTEKKLKVNSAYNHVLHVRSNYWICNDLETATKQNKYYSSSQNYTSYYKSLAIFVIADKDIEDNLIPLNNIKGLLIIDSLDKGAFDKPFIKEVGGYLTHKLNRFLSLEYFEDFFVTCNIK
jgi:V8-like Glu-specific endopeptidase